MSEALATQLALLPDYLGRHLLVSVVALAGGLAIGLPLAVLSLQRARLRWAGLALASVIQTVPSLALLALMVPLLVAFGGWTEALGLPRPRAIGFVPTVVALTLYSLLPILRNTVLGLTGVAPEVVEAARAVGMTPRQVLRRVQVPLALPVIVGGIRTAAVWVVGIATLSTAVGQTSLGNFIFGGLQTRNWTAVTVGCVAAAALALALDALIGMAETAARRRSRTLGLTAGTGLALLLIVGLTPLAWNAGGEAGAPVRIGAKNFNEQFVLAALIEERLEAAGLRAEQRPSLGSTIAFDALAAGELDVYVDYSGTLWRTLMHREDTPDAAAVLAGTTAWLASEHGIICLGALGFENAYALAVRRETAERLGLARVDDLVPHAGGLSIGSDVEFFSRPEWTRLRETYGLAFAETVSMQPTLMYRAVDAGEVDVITAFSSDGRIAAYDLAVLHDSRSAFPPYDAVLLLSHDAARRAEVVATLAPLVGAIDVETMRHANRLVDVDGRTPEQAARWLAEALR